MPQQPAAQDDGLEWAIDESGWPRFYWVVNSATQTRTVFATKAIIESNNFHQLQSTMTTSNLRNVKLIMQLRNPSEDIEDGDFDRTKSKLEDLIQRCPLVKNEEEEINSRSLFINRCKSGFFNLKIQHPFTGTRYNILGNEPYQKWKKSLDDSYKTHKWNVSNSPSAPPSVIDYLTNPVPAFDLQRNPIPSSNLAAHLKPGTAVQVFSQLACFHFSDHPRYAFVSIPIEIRVLPPFGTPENPYPTSDVTVVHDYPGPPMKPRADSPMPLAVPLPHTPSTPTRADPVLVARFRAPPETHPPASISLDAQRAAFFYPSPPHTLPTSGAAGISARGVPDSPTRRSRSTTLKSEQDDSEGELRVKSEVTSHALGYLNSSLKRRYSTLGRDDVLKEEVVKEEDEGGLVPSKRRRTDVNW